MRGTFRLVVRVERGEKKVEDNQENPFRNKYQKTTLGFW